MKQYEQMIFREKVNNYVNKNNVFPIVSLFIVLYSYFNGYILLLFVSNFILVLSIVYKARFSIFSLKVFITFYVLVPVFYQHYFNKSFGILQISSLFLHTSEINLILFVYGLINYVFICNTDILCLEKKIIHKLEYFKNSNILLMSILAILFILIFYPPSFLSDGTRFYHILPGNFWNHFSVICLIIILPSIKKRKIGLFAWAFVIVWCFIKKERVDALGILIILIMYLVYNKVISKRFAFILFVFFVSYLTAMGLMRIGINYSSFGDFIYSVLVQSTSSDIAYILNTSVHYVEEYGYLYGKTYINYLFELLPLGTSSYDASSILYACYWHPGGIHVLSEPYINFGYMGIILYSLLECLILRFIISRKHKISVLYYLFLLSSLFRYCWYGARYIETGFVYLIPIMYFVYHFSRVRRGKKYVFDKITV